MRWVLALFLLLLVPALAYADAADDDDTSAGDDTAGGDDTADDDSADDTAGDDASGDDNDDNDDKGCGVTSAARGLVLPGAMVGIGLIAFALGRRARRR